MVLERQGYCRPTHASLQLWLDVQGNVLFGQSQELSFGE